jgi:hypothetical protein
MRSECHSWNAHTGGCNREYRWRANNCNKSVATSGLKNTCAAGNNQSDQPIGQYACEVGSCSGYKDNSDNSRQNCGGNCCQHSDGGGGS